MEIYFNIFYAATYAQMKTESINSHKNSNQFNKKVKIKN